MSIMTIRDANDSSDEPVACSAIGGELGGTKRPRVTKATHATRDHTMMQARSETNDVAGQRAIVALYMRYMTFVRTMRRLMESGPDGFFTLYPRDVRDESLAQIASQSEKTPAEVAAIIDEVRDEVASELDDEVAGLGLVGPLPWPWSGGDADEAFKAFFGLPITDGDDEFDDEYAYILHRI